MVGGTVEKRVSFIMVNDFIFSFYLCSPPYIWLLVPSLFKTIAFYLNHFPWIWSRIGGYEWVFNANVGQYTAKLQLLKKTSAQKKWRISAFSWPRAMLEDLIHLCCPKQLLEYILQCRRTDIHSYHPIQLQSQRKMTQIEFYCCISC